MPIHCMILHKKVRLKHSHDWVKSLVNSSSALSCQLAQNLNFSNFGFAHKQIEIKKLKYEKKSPISRTALMCRLKRFGLLFLFLLFLLCVWFFIMLNFSTFGRSKDASIVRLFVFRSNLNKWCCFCVIWFAAMAPFFCCFGRISYSRIDGNSKGVTYTVKNNIQYSNSKKN